MAECPGCTAVGPALPSRHAVRTQCERRDVRGITPASTSLSLRPEGRAWISRLPCADRLLCEGPMGADHWAASWCWRHQAPPSGGRTVPRSSSLAGPRCASGECLVSALGAMLAALCSQEQQQLKPALTCRVPQVLWAVAARWPQAPLWLESAPASASAPALAPVPATLEHPQQLPQRVPRMRHPHRCCVQPAPCAAPPQAGRARAPAGRGTRPRPSLAPRPLPLSSCWLQGRVVQQTALACSTGWAAVRASAQHLAGPRLP